MASRQKRSLHLARENWRLESKTTAKILLVLVGFGVLSWLSLTQTSKVASTRYRILKKQAERAYLQRENAESVAQIMEMVQVADLEKQALELGYVFADRVRYLKVPGYAPAHNEAGEQGSRGAEEQGSRGAEEQRSGGAGDNVPQHPGTSAPLHLSRLWHKVISQFEEWMGE